MTSKQRANLRSMASKTEPIFQVGKGGISKDLADGVSDALDKRELVKLNVLKACELTAREVGEQLSARLSAELVCAIGNKTVLYRKSRRDIEHIEF